MRLSVSFDSLPIYLDEHLGKGEAYRWTQEILDRNQNRCLLIISTTVQDNGPFCHIVNLQVEIRGCCIRLQHIENMGTAMSCFNFSVRMRRRVCAWFTTTFLKKAYISQDPGIIFCCSVYRPCPR